jgi:hypothetical protein
MEICQTLTKDSKEILKIHLNLDRIAAAFKTFTDKPEAWVLLSPQFLGIESINYRKNWLGMVTWDKNWRFFFKTLKKHQIKVKFFFNKRVLTQVRLQWAPKLR